MAALQLHSACEGNFKPKKDETLSPYALVKFSYSYLQPSLNSQNCSCFFFCSFSLLFFSRTVSKMGLFSSIRVAHGDLTDISSGIQLLGGEGRGKLLFVQAITSWRIQGPVLFTKFIRALVSNKSQVWALTKF